MSDVEQSTPTQSAPPEQSAPPPEQSAPPQLDLGSQRNEIPIEYQDDQVEGTWLADVPASMRRHVAKFENPAKLAEGYANLNNLVGKPKINTPQTDEEWADYYNKGGRPETSDEYELQISEEISNDFISDDELNQLVAETAPFFHKLGLNPKQAQGVLEQQLLTLQNAAQEQEKQREAHINSVVDELHGEWGDAFELNVQAAQHAVQIFGGEGALEWLDQSGLATDPSFLKLMLNVAKEMGADDKLQTGGGGGIATADQLQNDLDQLMLHPAFSRPTHPEHQQIVAQYKSLLNRLPSQKIEIGGVANLGYNS